MTKDRKEQRIAEVTKLRRVLSLGAGVQSTFLALAMTERYRIDKVYAKLKGSVVIFADTGSEKPETIKYWEEVIKPELIASEIEYYVVRSGRGKLHEDYRKLNAIPFRMSRSCTANFKLKPIKDKMDEIFSSRLKDEEIEMYLGITTDEAHRMKPSKVKYIRNMFPLIDLGYSRDDLYGFYDDWDLGAPVKSGCFCCPFAKADEMIQLSVDHPKLIDIVIDLEENARKHRPRKIGKSLNIVTTQLLNGKYTVKQIIDGARSQTSLDDWDMDECEGACFL